MIWKTGPEYIGGIPIYREKDQHFCTVSRGDGYDAHAFANLIAAAPDLLRCLEGLAGLAAQRGRLHEYKAAVQDARAAIKKATGL